MQKDLFKPSIPALSFLISLSGSAIGVYVFPVFFEAGAGEYSSSKLLTGTVLLIALTIAILALTAAFFKASGNITSPGSPQRKTLKTIGGLFLLLVLFAVCAIIISLLYGLIAVLICKAAGDTFLFQHVKGIVTLVTSVLTLLVLPVFIQVFFTYGTAAPASGRVSA
jgi:hypothetical protein